MKPPASKVTKDFDITGKLYTLTLLDPEQSGLLGLPAELMNAILELVFDDCHVVIELFTCPRRIRHPRVIHHTIPLGLLAANRKLRALSLPFLPGLHIHAVDKESWYRGPCETPNSKTQIKRLPKLLRVNVGSLAIDICRIEPDIRQVLPNLNRLIITGCRELVDRRRIRSMALRNRTIREQVEAKLSAIAQLLTPRFERAQGPFPPSTGSRRQLKYSFEILMYGGIPRWGGSLSYDESFDEQLVGE